MEFLSTAVSAQNVAPYFVELFQTTPLRCAQFEDYQKCEELCRVGCKNYGKKWSCPPHSPKFVELTSRWSKLYILYLRMPLDPFTKIKNRYLRVKAANHMLKSRADKYMRALAKEYGAYISTGSCRLCKRCKLQGNEPCAHPDCMAYSFEALGINVDALVKEFSTFPLLWYKRGEPLQYTAVVCGLLTNKSLPLKLLKDQYITLIEKLERNAKGLD